MNWRDHAALSKESLLLRTNAVSPPGDGPGRPGTRPRADSADRGPATTADCPRPDGHSPRACLVTGPFKGPGPTVTVT